MKKLYAFADHIISKYGINGMFRTKRNGNDYYFDYSWDIKFFKKGISYLKDGDMFDALRAFSICDFERAANGIGNISQSLLGKDLANACIDAYNLIMKFGAAARFAIKTNKNSDELEKLNKEYFHKFEKLLLKFEEIEELANRGDATLFDIKHFDKN